MKENTALIVVDLNNDFMPGGSLGIADADQVVPVINELAANGGYQTVIALQDWHCENHSSFEQWPEHCVAGTRGAELHPDFDLTNVDERVRKGYDRATDSYSGFFDENGTSNGLQELLEKHGIEAVDVVGLATDYCVKATALDAATKAGLKTRVLLKGCRGVGLEAQDIPAAIDAMESAGVEVLD